MSKNKAVEETRGRKPKPVHEKAYKISGCVRPDQAKFVTSKSKTMGVSKFLQWLVDQVS